MSTSGRCGVIVCSSVGVSAGGVIVEGDILIPGSSGLQSMQSILLLVRSAVKVSIPGTVRHISAVADGVAHCLLGKQTL